MKWLDIVCCLIAIVSVALCQRIIVHSLDNQKRKIDYAELNHIQYGLLSIDAWKSQLGEILSAEIDKLYLSKENERLLRQQIEALLHKLIDQIERKMKDEHADTLGEQIAQSLINTFVDFDELKKGVPEYTNTVIREIKKAQTKEQIKSALHKQLEQYSKQTFDTQDPSPMHRILANTGAPDITSAKNTLAAEIAATKDVIATDVVLLIVLSAIPFAVYGLSKTPLSRFQFFLLLPPLLMLLAGGVSTPAIDLEAKISQVRFILLAHPVQFENQILYFKSKSILQVFRILINHEEVQMKAVAILLITFSIIFPVLKIVSSTAHYLDVSRARHNPVIRFFVVHSGKWSMADVLVVAMFMAYIGFDGIVSNQLDELSSVVQSRDLAILTTNGTALQPGFYLFLAYTLLALLFSGMVTRTSKGPMVS